MNTPVYFVLTPNYLALDFAGPAEVLRVAADEGLALTLSTFGPERRCQSSLGLVSEIGPLPDALPDNALLVLVGTVNEAHDYQTEPALRLVHWLGSSLRADTRVACICSGALLAAMAGLLDGRRCTTHHALTATLRALAPTAHVEENRLFVEDGPLATSAGITAGVDLALRLVERLGGVELAARVARRMVVWARRSGADPQLPPQLAARKHLHPAVHRAQDALDADPARAWPLAELARLACVSERHLSRLFREHAGCSVGAYRQTLQLARAHATLEQGATVEAAASAAGFDSARTLRRVWRAHYGESPLAGRAGAARAR